MLRQEFAKSIANKLQKWLFMVVSVILFFLLLLGILILGYFNASNFLIPLLGILISFILYKLLRKFLIKLTLSFITLFIVAAAYVLYSGFEEDFCLKKGEQAMSKSQNSQVTATAEDAINLKSFGIKEGSQIRVDFKNHMLCHTSFNFRSDLIESYTEQLRL